MEELWNDFLIERSKILGDIRHFLRVVLLYCMDQEDNWGFRRDVIATYNYARSLIESLCLIHALYGYPNTDSTTAGVNKYAVKYMLLNEIRERNRRNEMITFVRYCEDAANNEFWRFEFNNRRSSVNSRLPREPAHIFLQMVRDLFGNRWKASSIGQRVLMSLPKSNRLKPKVWAQHKTIPARFGVSLGVRTFVRPLYLYIKLSQLRNVEYGQLEDVKAFRLKHRYKKVKEPCVSCQIFFGIKNIAPVGNCAEYDVIGNVNPHLLLTDQWEEFQSACQQHFNAFNTMLGMLEEPRYSHRRVRQIMRTYFENTRNPERPKVLKYQWNLRKEVLELILEDSPPTRQN